MIEIDLGNRNVVVVGAGGGGIGTGIASVAHGAGADVFAIDIDLGRFDALDADLRASDRFHELSCDVRDPAQLEACMDEIERAGGPIAGLVNVVGGNWPDELVPALDYTPALFDQVLEMNLKYVNNTCRLAAASMIRNGGGSIVNVSSIASVSANPFGIAYSAAKAGVNAYSNTAAIEWAQHGIRVNVVAPGNTRTPKNSAEVTPDVESGRVPLNRRGRPEDIGYAVLFFLSDLSGYVTGQFIAVDGGSLTLPSSLSGDLLPAAVSGLPHADIMRGRMTDAIARARVGGPADHE